KFYFYEECFILPTVLGPLSSATIHACKPLADITFRTENKNMKQVEIPLSKKKMYLMLIGSIVFVLIGVWIILAQPMVRNVFFNNPIVKNVSGILAILFFGAVAISLSRKVQDNTPGLIVNEDGILDNSSAISAGFISWAEIINIEVFNIANQNF